MIIKHVIVGMNLKGSVRFQKHIRKCIMTKQEAETLLAYFSLKLESNFQRIQNAFLKSLCLSQQLHIT
jgi:hypothetical protein